MVKLYEVKIRLCTPTILTRRHRRNIFEVLTKPLSIPSRSIRGALIDSLARELSIKYGISKTSCLSNRGKREECDALIDEIMDPVLRIRPAYLVMRGKETEPASPFVYIKKIKHPGEKTLFTRITVNELSNIMSIDELAEIIPPVREGYPKSQHGELIIVYDGEIEKVDIYKSRHESTAINRKYYIAEKGMLFSYETLPAGLEFVTTIFDPDDLISRIMNKIDTDNKLEIFLGRGRSRGFGKAIMELKEKDIEKKIDKRAKEIARASVYILKALSPSLKIVDGQYSKPYIENVRYPPSDLKSPELGIQEAELNIRKIQITDGERPFVVGSLMKISGWSTSFEGSGPIPRYYAGAPGSIHVYEVHSVEPERALAYIELTGLDELSPNGFNWFKVITTKEVI